MKFYDSHNHLQDERLLARAPELLATAAGEGVERMVVNGSCESDWPQVLELACRNPIVLPSFGNHPWYVHKRSPEWQKILVQHLDAIPSAIGEIGLDRWIKEPDVPGQEEVFLFQLGLAAERNLPASIHCLQAWGRLYDLLRENPRPERGFLLHSYGGPVEMVAPLAKLGARFSFPGYFAHERKARQRAAFLQVPPDRLLIETDAPDQLPPESCRPFPLIDAAGKDINHPANLRAIYEFVAQMLAEKPETLAARVEENFLQLFGSLL